MVQIFYGNPILDSRRLIFEWVGKSGFHIWKALSLKFEHIRRHNFVQSAVLPIGGMAQGCHKTQYPHKWGNSQQAGESGCMGLVACLAGCRELLRPYARFQDVPTSGHVRNK